MNRCASTVDLPGRRTEALPVPVLGSSGEKYGLRGMRWAQGFVWDWSLGLALLSSLHEYHLSYLCNELLVAGRVLLGVRCTASSAEDDFGAKTDPRKVRNHIMNAVATVAQGQLDRYSGCTRRLTSAAQPVRAQQASL